MRLTHGYVLQQPLKRGFVRRECLHPDQNFIAQHIDNWWTSMFRLSALLLASIHFKLHSHNMRCCDVGRQLEDNTVR